MILKWPTATLLQNTYFRIWKSTSKHFTQQRRKNQAVLGVQKKENLIQNHKIFNQTAANFTKGINTVSTS